MRHVIVAIIVLLAVPAGATDRKVKWEILKGPATPLSGIEIRVSDIKVTLARVSAPIGWESTLRGRTFLDDLIGARDVECDVATFETLGLDSKREAAGDCRVDGESLSEAIIKSGLAVHSREFYKADFGTPVEILEAAEKNARKTKRGIWAEILR